MRLTGRLHAEDKKFTNILELGPGNGLQHKALSVPGYQLSMNKAYASDYLPKIGVSGLIPVNKSGERLDLHLLPSRHDFTAYNSAVSKYSRPCNNHHLTNGGCSLRKCPFSHELFSDGAMLGL